MANSPPEDLVVYARTLNRDVMTLLRDPNWSAATPDATDWRFHVPPIVRTLWGRIDFEAKLVAFAVAERSTRTNGRNIGDEIIEGLREAIAFERGESTGASFKPAPIPTASTISARHVDALPAPAYTPGEIARIRARLKLSQSVFARALNVSAETERAWEQGKAPPTGSARRLLQIAEAHPDVLLELVVAK